jgi:anti-sigma28 factor (negative regulator of flagellin synthesis)
MVTTLVRNSDSALRPGSPAAGTRRFNAAGTPPRLRAAVRAGDYVVDADAVAAALFDRLQAGGSHW